MVIPHSAICQQNMALLQSVDIADAGSAVMVVHDDRGGRSSTVVSCPTEDGSRLRWEDPYRVINTWRSCGTLRTDFRANLCSVLGSIVVVMNACRDCMTSLYSSMLVTRGSLVGRMTANRWHLALCRIQLILGSKQHVVCPAGRRGLSCWGDVE
ncbi:hypothetical protein BDZ85DRAFT_74635 [Elsinoe ampelina]|uniref:Uncharacterized protein n=1 Tax=Elsinoe ampelina TaxID=302913 RepID=A0A6A6GKL6_9PEZI|nr:hypothetical protein BDZ85DRAFT_74635 [Elsinoe ampelina]